MLLRRVGLLCYAGILGLFAALALTAVASFILEVLPSGIVLALASFVFGTAIELLRCAVMGFFFWSGTHDSWKRAGAWTFAGALVGHLLPLLPRFRDAGLLLGVLAARPVFFALVLLVCAAGSFLGAWYADRTDHEAWADHLRSLAFSMYPFALPR